MIEPETELAPPLWYLTRLRQRSHFWVRKAFFGKNLELDAEIQLPSGDLETGLYRGERVNVKVRKHGLPFFRVPLVQVSGVGIFTSESGRFSFEGRFLEDKFHDVEGKSTYTLFERTRYTGCFQRGQRHGYGKLERYSPSMSTFFLYFEGQWKYGKEWQGSFYRKDGCTFFSIDNGVLPFKNIATSYIEVQRFPRGKKILLKVVDDLAC